MHAVILRPLSPAESQRLFAQTCLSTSHYVDKWEGEASFSLFYLFDSLIGLIRLPYLYTEVQKVIEAVKAEGKLQFIESETLAVIASAAEICIWCAERKFIILNRRGCNVLQGICYLSRMIIYERAVLQEGETLFMMWKGRQTDKKEFNHLKVQFISHLTYLGWVAHNLIMTYNGKAYPQKYLRYLHIVSIIFGLIASGYEEMDPNLRRAFKKFVPQRSIYCF
ncbi:MAG: hypothetical protein H7A41_01615 [Chlamydiales bacterium]|nr:hypothetical protein [Chlamydiia bacterium]MCB1110310.1 hypothetical protein [Chlamydiia bacterium]MCP5503828.1 hypothetical protein [Chlamydiales bacterium]